MLSHRILRLLMVSSLLLLLGTAPVRATTYYVATTGSDRNPGSQSQPFLTFQKGLVVAQSGDGVLVSPGVYSGTGNLDLDFAGKSIHLQANTAQSGSVVLDCQQAGRGFHFHSGESSSAIVEGLTIAHAHAPDGITDPGDFHLLPTSPCIDVGHNADLPSGITTDLDGNPRIINGVVDLGAYEFQRPTDVTGQITMVRGGFRLNRATGLFVQTVTLTNTGGALNGPVSLVLDHLSASASLFNKTGLTSAFAPANSPYINATTGALAAGASVAVTLEFTDPTMTSITYSTRVLAGMGSR